jgi:hypothetical protein
MILGGAAVGVGVVAPAAGPAADGAADGVVSGDPLSVGPVDGDIVDEEDPPVAFTDKFRSVVDVAPPFVV